MSNTDPIKNTGGELAKGKQILLKNTPAVLLICTVKSGKSLGSDREKKTSP